MSTRTQDGKILDPETKDYYCKAIQTLLDSGVPFLVGGTYAFARYTGIERHTKDFDIFVRPKDTEKALEVFKKAGYRTELTFPHWLGKAYNGENFIDIIFCSGNGLARVDEEWFEHSVEEKSWGCPLNFVPRRK